MSWTPLNFNMTKWHWVGISEIQCCFLSPFLACKRLHLHPDFLCSCQQKQHLRKLISETLQGAARLWEMAANRRRYEVFPASDVENVLPAPFTWAVSFWAAGKGKQQQQYWPSIPSALTFNAHARDQPSPANHQNGLWFCSRSKGEQP